MKEIKENKNMNKDETHDDTVNDDFSDSEVFGDVAESPPTGFLRRTASIRRGVLRTRSEDGKTEITRVRQPSIRKRPKTDSVVLRGIRETNEINGNGLGSGGRDRKKDRKHERDLKSDHSFKETKKTHEISREIKRSETTRETRRPDQTVELEERYYDAEYSFDTVTGDQQLCQRSVIIRCGESGFGFTIGRENPVFITTVRPDGPAARAGVKEGDRIIKVNGTLVTNSNHNDVVGRIRAAEYVQLTLLGKPPEAERKDVTHPQPADPSQSRKFEDDKYKMMNQMYGQARETYEKTKREYEKYPTDKNRLKRDDSFKTLKNIEGKLPQLHSTPPMPMLHEYPQSDPTEEFTSVQDDKENAYDNQTDWGSKIVHTKSPSMPESMYDATQPPPGHEVTVSRSHSDNRRRHLVVSDTGSFNKIPREDSDQFSASSLPTSQADIYIDSDDGSPVASPTPTHPNNTWGVDDMDPSTPTEFMPNIGYAAQEQKKIFSMEDSDFETEEEPTTDHGPFASFELLRNKPAHLSVFLHFLISNSDPNPLLFYLVTDIFGQTSGGLKDQKKWASDIYNAFLAEKAPLNSDIQFNEEIDKLSTDDQVRHVFRAARDEALHLIDVTLKDYKEKRVLGLANIYGDHELQGREMDKQTELNYVERKLEPHLKKILEEKGDRDHTEAMTAALMTYIKSIGGHIKNQAILDAVPHPFCSKARLKELGKTSKKGGLRGKKGNRRSMLDMFPGIRKPSTNNAAARLFNLHLDTNTPATPTNQQTPPHSYPVHEARRLHDDLTPGSASASPGPPLHHVNPVTHEEEEQFRGTAVSPLVTTFNHGDARSETPPRSRSPDTPGGDQDDQKPSVNLSRSESLNRHQKDPSKNKVRRTRSDVTVDPNVIKSLNSGSGSSSNSSLSASTSTEAIPEVTSTIPIARQILQQDSDFDTEQELPGLDTVMEAAQIKKLKPKEKKRQDVINELFHSEKAHVRALKVMYKVFYIPMVKEPSVHDDLVKTVFPNLEDLLDMHDSLNKTMKAMRQQNAQIGDVAQILLDRFDGEEGEKFKTGSATFCCNQTFAFEMLRHRRRKDQKFNQFLIELASDPLCRRLELKDFLPTVMQRLTKYPLLIENLMKYTQSNSEEYIKLKKALSLSKDILFAVNQAVSECEMRHKLYEYQKKLEKKGIEGTTIPSLREFKDLDLRRHKLLYEGPLTWRINKHKQIDLQCLLLESILVLLQKQDDKYVLKCHSSILGKDVTKFTHSPIIKLSDVLPKNVATDKRAFFVVSTSDTTPQIYDLVAMSTDEKRRWFKYLEEAANKAKERKPASRTPSKHISPSPDITAETSSVNGEESTRIRDDLTLTPEVYEKKSNASFDTLTPEEVTEISELVAPTEVTVSSSVLENKAQQILTPLELLKRKDEEISQALVERNNILADIFEIPHDDFENIAEMAEADTDNRDPRSIALVIAHQTHKLMQVFNERMAREDHSIPDEGATSSRNIHDISLPRSTILQITSVLGKKVRSLVEAIEVDRATIDPVSVSSQHTVEVTGSREYNSLSPSNSVSHRSRPNSFISETSTASEEQEHSEDSVILVTSSDESAFILSPQESTGEHAFTEQPAPTHEETYTTENGVSEFQERLNNDPDIELWQRVDADTIHKPEEVTSTGVAVMQESSIQQYATETFLQVETLTDANANLNTSSDSLEQTSDKDSDSTNTLVGASF